MQALQLRARGEGEPCLWHVLRGGQIMLEAAFRMVLCPRWWTAYHLACTEGLACQDLIAMVLSTQLHEECALTGGLPITWLAQKDWPIETFEQNGILNAAP